MTVNEYKKLHKSTKGTIEGWIEKGYMPGVEPPMTEDTVIPDDMPVPYRSNGKTQKNSTLFAEILRAADVNQSVYPAMFPKIPDAVFFHVLSEMVEKEYITIQESATGAPFVSLAVEGIRYQQQEKRAQKTAGERFAAGLNTVQGLLTVAQIVYTMYPQAVQLFQTLAQNMAA